MDEQAPKRSTAQWIPWIAAIGTALGGIAAVVALVSGGGGDNNTATVTASQQSGTITISSVTIADDGKNTVAGTVKLSKKGTVYLQTLDKEFNASGVDVYVLAENVARDRFVSQPGSVTKKGGWKVALAIPPGVKGELSLRPGLFPRNASLSDSPENLLKSEGKGAFLASGNLVKVKV